jgi:predicted secreted protein
MRASTHPALVRAAAVAAIAFAAAFAVPARSQQPLEPVSRNNLVDIQAEAQREVQNDTLNAILYLEQNDSDPARLANAGNRIVNEALALAREARGVRARSGNSQTWPVYDRTQKLIGWRGRVELRLDSKDFQAAAALIAKLQGKMQLGQVSFIVSPDLRREVENEIIGEAIAAFRGRAQIVGQALGAKSWRIRRMSVNTGGGMVPMRALASSRQLGAEAAVTPQQFEGGVSQITVNVGGTVEIE